MQRQGTERQRIRAGSGRLQGRGNREQFVAAGVVDGTRAGAGTPAAGDDLDADFTGHERILGIYANPGRQQVAIGVARNIEDGGHHGAVCVPRKVRGAGPGDPELVAVDARGVNRGAGRAEESDVDIALGIQRLQAHRGAVRRAGKLGVGLGRRLGHCRRVEREPLDLRCAGGAAQVRPRRAEEAYGHRDALARGRYRILEGLGHRHRITECAVVGSIGRLHNSRVIDSQSGNRRAAGVGHGDKELGSGIRDRPVVQADTVRILVGDVDVGQIVDAGDRGR